jgi:Glycosyl transferases group 1/Methyltransferase domain/DUF based on E. rectale Gene description (DUF3880)
MGILRSGGRWICARVAGEALDVGCGDEEIASLLEREGHRVVAVDPRRAGALPFDDGSFDTVLLGEPLASQVSRERPIAEARRVLRPGGRLIVAVPYGGAPGDDEAGVSLEELLDELAELSVKEIAPLDERLCLLAERAREKSRAAVWRRALGVAERRLAERDEAVEALSVSVSELEARRRHEEQALAGARGDVEQLETALAAAAHQRDRREEEARLAGEGVAVLEQRLERMRRDAEKERAGAERDLAKSERKREVELAESERERQAAREAAERSREAIGRLEEDLAGGRRSLEAREKDLAEAAQAVQAGERELAGLRARLETREEELERALAAAQETQRELGLVGERLAIREGELAAASAVLDAQTGELAQVRESLEAKRRDLENARAGIEARDRRLEVAGQGAQEAKRELDAAGALLEARGAELAEARRATRRSERELALAEARLEKARQRAERFRGSLVTLRESRSYRLMRVLWRLRHPFRRTSRATAAEPAPADEDADSSDVPGVRPLYGHSITGTSPEVAAPPPPSPREPGERLRVAAILDEMSEACFAPECDLVPLGFDTWPEQLDEQRPDLLLVESAWNGNGGEWQYRIARYPRKDLAGLPALRALLDGCRERGIPTAFWNKEDPVHFERFAEAAALFDHVFTTDARCVERYRALPGVGTVAPLPFAAQPRIHNPAAVVERRSASPCFAGAWYRDRHPDRRRALEALLDAARPHGLVIYDRSFGGEDGAFGFPERFAPHVLGQLPYERILDVYRSHRVFLNANSVVDSPTMCSRRVFELAACDTAILSTPGAALAALLGEGMVVEAGDEQAAAAALERLLGDERARARRTRAARRAVFAAHTYAERLATIAEAAGLDASALRRPPFAVPGAPPNGAGESASASRDSHPWVLQLLPGVSLSEPALADVRAAAAFADADVIGTHPARNGNPPVEHRYAPEVDPRALLVRRELIESRGRPAGSAEQMRARLREWSDDGVRIYAADADWLPAGEPHPESGGQPSQISGSSSAR